MLRRSYEDRRLTVRRQGERRQELHPDYRSGEAFENRRQGERRQGDRRVSQRREPPSREKMVAMLKDVIRDLQRLYLAATGLLEQGGHSPDLEAVLRRTQKDACEAERQAQEDLAAMIGSDD